MALEMGLQALKMLYQLAKMIKVWNVFYFSSYSAL